MRRPWLVGLTGPAGSGKSTILGWLAERGAATLDADTVVHVLLASDSAVADTVRQAFPGIARPDGTLDRAALGERVFAHPADLAKLEAMVHPAVDREIQRWLAGCSVPVAVIEGIKLVEAGMHKRCDSVWLTMCDLDVRRERLHARGWTDREIGRRIASAPPLAPELAAADEVIDNSGPWTATAGQLAAAWAREQAQRHLQEDGSR